MHFARSRKGAMQGVTKPHCLPFQAAVRNRPESHFPHDQHSQQLRGSRPKEAHQTSSQTHARDDH